MTLFFVLSAYLLARPFLAKHRRGEHASATSFWQRRALRILPLYTVAVVTGALATAETWRAVIDAWPYLLFLNSIAGMVDPMMPWSAVWWSLATEVQFYLLLPPVFVLARWPATRLLLAALALGWLALYATMVRGGSSHLTLAVEVILSGSIIGRAPAFLFGGLVAWADVRFGSAWTRGAAARPWLSRGGADAGVALLLLALGWLLTEVVRLGFFQAERQRPLWHLPEGVLWALVLGAVLWMPLRVSVLLRTRAMEFVGVVSYSAYLWHFPIQCALIHPLATRYPELIDGWTPAALLLAGGALAVTLAVSAFTYRVVERPFLVRKARIG